MGGSYLVANAITILNVLLNEYMQMKHQDQNQSSYVVRKI